MAAAKPMNADPSSFTLALPLSDEASSSSQFAAPGTSTPAQPSSSEPSSLQHLMHKNRLHDYAQRSNIPLPIYQTVNEGLAHAPKFRSTVWVDGKYYTSENVFSVRKMAEQDVAKLAFQRIVTRIKDEGLPLILEKTMAFKSILNEYVDKENLDKVTHTTVKQEGHSFFLSSLVFNGKCYTGDPARSKKEAEQLAARAAILSNLGDSEIGPRLSEIIKSKFKFCAAITNVKDLQRNSTVSTIANTEHTFVRAAPVAANNKEIEVALPECSSRVLPPQQEFQLSKPEKSLEDSKLPNVSVQAGAQQYIDDNSNLKKRKKKKKKANKKSRLDALLPVAAAAFSLDLNLAPPISFATPSCSVAQ